ncbi:MAG: type III-A CRISPR-associated RAMP protein Csm4 [Methylococcus sp.]
MYRYRLAFTAPFHIDSRGNDNYEQAEPCLRSDTLSAAILAVWARLAPEGAAERAAAPPYRLSSAMPWAGDIRFLPRPIPTLAVRLEPERLRDNKRLKKIQWLSENLWRAVAGGLPLNDADAIQIRSGGLALLRDERLPVDPLWVHEERPRLAMDRAANAHAESLLFHFGRVWFQPEAGLYFLAEFDSDAARAGFETALALLGDEGIGADRSSGNGAFRCQPEPAPEVRLARAGPAMALSLVNPAPADQRQGWLDGAAWKLASRGGWTGQTGLRKRRLRMFAEGSVFPQPLAGRVADVTPERAPHPVYRDGRGFFIAWRTEPCAT